MVFRLLSSRRSSTMGSMGGYCRCCYSVEALDMLNGPVFDVYMLICNPQGAKDDNQIITCVRCRQFLKEVHRFKIKCHAIDEIFAHNLDVKHFDVESILKSMIDDNSEIEIKTEVIDEYETGHFDVEVTKVEVDSDPEFSPEDVIIEYGEIDMIDIEYNKVEVDFDLENLQEITEELPESLLVPNNQINDQLERKIFTTHTNLSHSDKKCYICDHCSHQTMTKISMSNHIELKHFSTVKWSGRSYESVSHDDDKPYSCNQCSFRTAKTYRLSRHEMTHLKNRPKPFKCSRCSYKTDQKKSLNSHITNKHRNVRPFCCDHCGYQCKMRGNMVRHLKQHNKIRDRPFKCNECSHQSIDHLSLKRHMLFKHSDEKPYKCNFCMKRFKQKSDINTHLIIHTGSSVEIKKPHKCDKCSYRGYSKRDVRDHIACKHTDKKPFACDQCDYRAYLHKYLIVHKRRHLNG